MGAEGYPILKDYIHLLKEGVAIEIGSERGEGSTKYIHDLCKLYQIPFYSIDGDAGGHSRASEIVGEEHAFYMTGEEFLENILPGLPKNRISFAYLDNFDWCLGDDIKGARHSFYHTSSETYKRMGFELNNLNSQKSHLAQSFYVAQHMAYPCLIIFDDTWSNLDGTFNGKGGSAVPFLLACGFVQKPSPEGAVVLWKEDTSEGMIKRKFWWYP